MITDEERRQIAYRLHEEAENWRDFAKDDTLFDMCDATFVESVLSAFQLNDMDMHVCEAFDKLADLIDRPTTTRHGRFKKRHGWEVPLCEVCGYSIGDARWSYCPKCGAAILEVAK